MECVKCVCVWLGAWCGVRGECVRGLGFVFNNPVVTGGV